jgi:mannose-6-phosphate isomerase-like protein (cupin superfamily)
MMPPAAAAWVAAQHVRRVVMRRFSVFLPVVVVVLLGFVIMGVRPVAVAQEATPPSDEMNVEGLTFEPIGFVQGVTLPSPADLGAARAGFEPGTGFPLEASDPEGAFVVVESGTLTVQIEEMTWTISRSSGSSEEVALGEEATLEAGDSAYVPGSVTGKVRNNGQERAEALVFLVSPAGAMAEATPQP